MDKETKTSKEQQATADASEGRCDQVHADYEAYWSEQDKKLMEDVQKSLIAKGINIPPTAVGDEFEF